jgi:phosphopantetheine--protein transferase-like protein
MQGSLARTRLDAAIRKRIGIRSPAVYSAKSFGELETAIFTDSTRPQPPSVVTFDRIHSGQPDISSPPISCGIDIQNVDDLPGAEDYREDDFYKLAFSPTEIAYCLLQENHRMHFAARWCAKEALKKCDAAYLDVEMSAIEMVNPGSGAPYLAGRLNGKAVRLPFAVSVSHTSSAVVAIVIKAAPQLVSPVSEGHVTEAETPRGDSPPEQASQAGSGLSLLVFSALVLAVWALIRTFL